MTRSAPAASPSRLGTNDLRGIVDAISGELRLKLIPGTSWYYEPTYNAIVYDHVAALEQHKDVATGTIYRSVGYAVHSKATTSPWHHVGNAVRIIERKVGKDLIAPRSVMALIHAMEEERVETMQRRHYAALEDNALPLRHCGYRAQVWKSDHARLKKIMPIGSFPRGLGVPDYWLRACIALKGIAAGALTQAELPPDMPWLESTCESIRALKDKGSIDEMLAGIVPVIVAIVAARVIEPEEPTREEDRNPQPGAPRDSSQPKRPASEGGPTNGTPPAPDTAQTSDRTTPSGTPTPDDADKRRAIQAETRATKPVDTSTKPDFLAGASTTDASTEEATKRATDTEGGGAAPTTQSGKRREHIAPSWAGVVTTTTTITGPLRKAVRRYFIENETGELERGLASGDLDIAAATDAVISREDRDDLFERRTMPAARSWKVYLLIDVSGSMQTTVNKTVLDPTVFGIRPNARWMLASRLTVAITHVLSRFPGVDVAIGVHDTKAKTLKSFGAKLSNERKDEVMRNIGAFGGTMASHGYAVAAAEFRRGRAPSNILIHLTDGQFGDECQNALRDLQAMHVHPVILTLGIAADSARRAVGNENADEVTDETLGLILNKHFRRFTGASRGRAA
jgi:hypothetical protein